MEALVQYKGVLVGNGGSARQLARLGEAILRSLKPLIEQLVVRKRTAGDQ